MTPYEELRKSLPRKKKPVIQVIATIEFLEHFLMFVKIFLN